MEKIYSVTRDKKFREDARKQFKFSGGTNDFVVHDTAWINLVLDALEQEGMLADFSELHKLITQPFDTTGFPVIANKMNTTTSIISEPT